jgi:hypothetical protein
LLTVLFVPSLWLLSAGICYIICRIRQIKVTTVQCLIIAGLPLALPVIPNPFPYIMEIAISYAITVYVTMKYLGVGLVPDGLLIPGTVQAAGLIATFIVGVLTH